MSSHGTAQLVLAQCVFVWSIRDVQPYVMEMYFEKCVQVKLNKSVNRFVEKKEKKELRNDCSTFIQWLIFNRQFPMHFLYAGFIPFLFSLCFPSWWFFCAHAFLYMFSWERCFRSVHAREKIHYFLFSLLVFPFRLPFFLLFQLCTPLIAFMEFLSGSKRRKDEDDFSLLIISHIMCMHTYNNICSFLFRQKCSHSVVLVVAVVQPTNEKKNFFLLFSSDSCSNKEIQCAYHSHEDIYIIYIICIVIVIHLLHSI